MCTSAIYGVPLAPAAVADEKGTTLTVMTAASPEAVEKLLRGACDQLGGSVGLSSSFMTAETACRVRSGLPRLIAPPEHSTEADAAAQCGSRGDLASLDEQHCLCCPLHLRT
jgi:hypothetical protein